MKFLLDTNVLISAFVFRGVTFKVLLRLLDIKAEIYVSEYVDKEFRDKLSEKWTDRAEQVYRLYRQLDFKFCKSANKKLGDLRDPKDIPILSDAIFNGVDVIITGDKDFPEADLEKPLVLSPDMVMDFLDKYF